MPSRFEVVPDVAADAALSLSDAFQVGQGWMSVVQVNARSMVRDATAFVGDGFKEITVNLTNSTVYPSEMINNASEWISNRSEALGNASVFESIVSAQAQMTPHAKAALLLAVFVWLFRELLVRSTARSLLRRHGYAQSHAHQL